MVTKLTGDLNADATSSVLAKIHMVTKQSRGLSGLTCGSVLAKIHMVTKPRYLSIS